MNDNKHGCMMTINIIFEVFRIKVDRILSLPVTSYDNFSHRSIPLCIEMIQTETALMRKRNKSDHIKSIRFFFFKKKIHQLNSHLSEKMTKNLNSTLLQMKKTTKQFKLIELSSALNLYFKFISTFMNLYYNAFLIKFKNNITEKETSCNSS